MLPELSTAMWRGPLKVGVPLALSVLPGLPATPDSVLIAICAFAPPAPSIIKAPQTTARRACRRHEWGSEFFSVGAGLIFMTDDIWKPVAATHVKWMRRQRVQHLG